MQTLVQKVHHQLNQLTASQQQIQRWLNAFTLHQARFYLSKLTNQSLGRSDWLALVYWVKRAGQIHCRSSEEQHILEAYLAVLYGSSIYPDRLTTYEHTRYDGLELSALDHLPVHRFNWIRSVLIEAICGLIDPTAADGWFDSIFYPQVELDVNEGQPALTLYVDPRLDTFSIRYSRDSSFVTDILLDDPHQNEPLWRSLFWKRLFQRLQ